MSGYKHFLVDFPSRIEKIFDANYTKATASDLEVTLMLAVATSGFTIPLERFRNRHPSADSKKFPDGVKKLRKLQKKQFIGSDLWKSKNASSWRYENKMECVDGNPDSWLQKATELPKDKTNDFVLRHLRNSLAHGNIFTRGDPIEQLVFLSRTDTSQPVKGTMECRWNEPGMLSAELELSMQSDIVQPLPDRYSLLAVSPDDFREFLKAWFEFLKTIELSLEVIQG